MKAELLHLCTRCIDPVKDEILYSIVILTQTFPLYIIHAPYPYSVTSRYMGSGCDTTGCGYNRVRLQLGAATTGCGNRVRLQVGAAEQGCAYNRVRLQQGADFNWVRLQQGAPTSGRGYNRVRLQQGAATTGCGYNKVRLQQGEGFNWVRLKLDVPKVLLDATWYGYSKVRAKVGATSTGMGSFKTTFLLQILPETSKRQIENALIQYL